VRAFDPTQKNSTLEQVALTQSLPQALQGADAAVVCTEWPDFRQANWRELAGLMKQKIVLDANRFLEKELKDLPGLEHLSVGQAP
jgi:UDPglucose 6-dehydrogenase